LGTLKSKKLPHKEWGPVLGTVIEKGGPDHGLCNEENLAKMSEKLGRGEGFSCVREGKKQNRKNHLRRKKPGQSGKGGVGLNEGG